MTNDPIQAWKYGPVLPKLYNQIRDFRSGAITSRLPKMWRTEELTDLQKELIDEVQQKYGHLSGISLSKLTHQPNTPWAQTYDPDYLNKTISNDLIQEHYQQLALAAAA